MKSKLWNVLSSFWKGILKIRFDQNTIECTTFMFLANQLMKFCIGGENLDTKLQVLPLPKTFRVYVYNNVRKIQSCESNYDNSLRSSARDTKLSKLRTITCNYWYKERLEINFMNISFAVGFSRRSSCILFK